MMKNNITWISTNGVRGDAGFVVQSVAHDRLEYSESPKAITVHVEYGHTTGDKSCVLISRSNFERWDGDPPDFTLPAEKQQELLDNFTAAMEFQGIAVVVD